MRPGGRAAAVAVSCVAHLRREARVGGAAEAQGRARGHLDEEGPRAGGAAGGAARDTRVARALRRVKRAVGAVLASDSHEALHGGRDSAICRSIHGSQAVWRGPRTVPEKENVSFRSSMTGRSMPSRVASSPLQSRSITEGRKPRRHRQEARCPSRQQFYRSAACSPPRDDGQ